MTGNIKKVKRTLVQALRLCTGRTVHRGSRGIALPFHDHDTRRGFTVSIITLSHFVKIEGADKSLARPE